MNITKNSKLFVYIGAIVIFAIGIIIGAGIILCRDKGPNPARLAEKSLLLNSDNPESVKISHISNPEPVYGRNLISDKELDDISERVMKSTEFLMKQGSSDISKNAELQEMMTRQLAAVAVIRNYNPDNASAKDNKDQTGWKIKIKYSANSHSGKKFKSEYWAYLDNNNKFVLKSFDIPIL